MGMSSVAGIAKDYLNSLRGARDKKLKPKIALVQICLPVGVGGCRVCCALRCPKL